MKRLTSPSALNQPAAADGPRGLAFLSAGGLGSKGFNTTWALAAAGLFFAATAANLLCLSPRWYSSKFISLVYEPARFVVLTAATGAAAVQIFWAALENKPSAGPVWIARNLSTAWVFLPCYVLLYERNSPWMLSIAALATLGTALSLRRLLPAPAAALLPRPQTTILPSLDGLPPRDSPLFLAFWIAILAQAAAILAVNQALLLATLPLCIGLFLLVWRWSTVEDRAARWWTGQHPPLPQAAAAILITSLALIPYSVVGRRFGFYAPLRPPPKPTQSRDSSGYYGIVLYPPPQKKQIVAPRPQSDSFASANAKPILIPFDGPYWYFKPPLRRPDPRAHVAHGKATDVNVRSTDSEPLLMQAHQNLGLPISLACCREIDINLTNADTRPGAISLALVLTDTASPGKPSQNLGALPIPSTQLDPMPLKRDPVNEVLRFPIPRSAGLHQFDEITIDFQLAPRHARAAAKVSINSFELIPK
jgi:hypothetical protein